MIIRQRISLTGRVQGIGFRPAVYKIARSLAITGLVYNDTIGVTIELQGPPQDIEQFLIRLKSPNDGPPLADIKTCQITDIPIIKDEHDFSIKPSSTQGTPLAQITADMAVCPKCTKEMSDNADFRYRYPFINCTNCGPRYSIVKTIPYDRPNTTMSDFQMCDKCSAQYNDVTDRRFHAQPVACPDCGPKIWLTDNKANTLETKSDQAITETAQLLKNGKILAIKGIGGFHLAVDALNEKAVKRLRQRKKRDHKPFALMTDSIDNIRKYTHLTTEAESLLTSHESPIVLLPIRENSKIAPSAAEGVNTFGFMLCYAPLHWLLFAQGLEVLVMTSGNISDEPLICDNQEALTQLADVADAFLMHDREIYRQVDDSIVHFIDNQPAMLRRARGYVPTPILSEQTSEMDIFAAGPDMKNTFCFAKQNQLITSEHIGDLEDAKVYHHYIDSVEHLRSLFQVEPKIVACDLHPTYLSTQYALAIPDVKTVQIQHHWAHAASVLAEHNLTAPAIALICDGTGYGTDAAIWGCECLIASLDDFKRFGHLSYYSLPGADKAGKEAIRPILGLLKQTYKDDLDLKNFAWLLDPIEPDNTKQKIILEQLNKSVNTVRTSSLGRVFDAVAAILALGTYNNFEAQLPMALEAITDQNIQQHYDFELISDNNEPMQLDLGIMLKQLLADRRAKTPAPVIAAKFHNCLAAALTEMAENARTKTDLQTVVLSGGVFCNRYLANRLITLLNKSDFRVLLNREVPANDGGISLGQAAIAAKLVAGGSGL